MIKSILLVLLLLPVMTQAVAFRESPLVLGTDSYSISQGTPFFSDHPSSILVNDAFRSTTTGIGVFHVNTISSYTYRSLAVSKPFKDWSLFAGLMMDGVSDIPKTVKSGWDNRFTRIGQYSYLNTVMKIGANKAFDLGVFGVGLSTYSVKADSKRDMAFSLSASAQFDAPFFHYPSTVAVAVRNPYFLSSQTLAGDTLPTTLLLAQQVHLSPKWDAHYQFLFRGGGDDEKVPFLIGVGGRYAITNVIGLSASMSQLDAITSRPFQASIGTDITFGSLNIDYAYRHIASKVADSQQHFLSLHIALGGK